MYLLYTYICALFFYIFQSPPSTFPFESSQTKDVRLVKTLLAFGANLNYQDWNHFTPLDLAMHLQCSDVQHILMDHGAKGSVRLIVRKHRLFSVVSCL